MSHFTFTLESLLQLRLRAEQQCQRDLASAQARLAQIETQLRVLCAQVDRAAADLRNSLHNTPLNPLHLATHARYQQSLAAESSRLQDNLNQARRALDHAKSALKSAASQRKSLEKLRQRQHEQFRLDHLKRERTTHDDLSTRITST